MTNRWNPLNESVQAEALPRPGRTCRRMQAWTEGRHRSDPRAESHYRESSASQPSRMPRNLEGLKVLVVDDDEDTVDLFAVALATCGAAVTTATTAVIALRLANEIRPDVILSDIAMPDGDGYWLLDQIRRLPDEIARRVPIVAATAFGQDHSRARALAVGFKDHLQKPVDPDVLCRTVANAAGR
jgi:CheY-like chemotaxis protein